LVFKMEFIKGQAGSWSTKGFMSRRIDNITVLEWVV
jgi:hypothetical protein